MTIDELAQKITTLPLADQLALLESISRSVRETIIQEQRASSPVVGASAERLDQISKRAGRPVPSDSALYHLLGVARTESPLTDAQAQDMLADALLEKHS
jgi:hypothetical protein